MIEISKYIFIGDMYDCFYEDREGWVVIHACKTPCHQSSVGYKGSIKEKDAHPQYLFKEEDNHLFLNLIDGNNPKYFRIEVFNKAMDFLRSKAGKKILIHCQEGLSRSPSIGLLYMAKISCEISDNDFNSAKNEFMRKYPNFQPNNGISSFLSGSWGVIK